MEDLEFLTTDKMLGKKTDGHVSSLLKLKQKGSVSGLSALEHLAYHIHIHNTRTTMYSHMDEYINASVDLDLELFKLHLIIKPKKKKG